MDDDCCYGDTGDYCYDTGGGCDYTGGDYDYTGGEPDYNGGGCDDSVTRMDFNTAPYEETTNYMETTFSDSVDVCIDEPYETYSCNVDYDYDCENTPRPVYSNLSRNNNTQIMDSDERIFNIMLNHSKYYAMKRDEKHKNILKWSLAIGFVILMCKLNVNDLFVLKF